MSLIDDALKRAQAADEASAGRAAQRPWIPTPMPDAGLARRRRIARRLFTLLAVAVLAAGGAVMLRKTASNPDTTREAGIGGPRPPVPGMTPTPLQVVVAVPTPTTPVPASAPRLRPTRAAAPPVSADAPQTVAPAPAPKPSGPIADGRTYAGSVNLPGGGKIELGGIVWSETEPRALLNDRVVGADSYVEGYRVVKIEEDRVALEKDGVTLYITVQ